MDDSLSHSIVVAQEKNEYSGEYRKDDNSLPEAVEALCKGLFRDNIIKMGKISGNNKKGMTQIVALNNYMEKKYNVRFETLDVIVEDCMQRNISIDATGIMSLIEALKALGFEIHAESGVSEKLHQLGR